MGPAPGAAQRDAVGINPHAASFLVAAGVSGANYERTLTIGRQRLFVDEHTLSLACRRAGRVIALEEARRLIAQRDGFAEPFLESLGAKLVDSIDASSYEEATIVHDLNQAVAGELEQRYSVVVDSGSLEHVFDFPTAIANCMRMAEVGGHVLMLTPVNGEAGQGFYQFSPELLYRVFSPENGFHVEQMLYKDLRLRSGWYAVSDPRDVGSRVVVTTRAPAYLYVKACRRAEIEPFSVPPQQSDYSALWADGAPPMPAPWRSGATRRLLPESARAVLPVAWKERYQEARGALRARGHERLDPRFFRQVDIARLAEEG
jgi:hypothetical protein